MSFASMPLFTGDYLRDTRHLTPMRHGIYMLLLMNCWDQKGPVPLDEQEAAGIANCRSADEIEGLRYVLDRYFVKMDDGWYNKRIADEVFKAEKLSAKNRENGMKSAAMRRGKVRSAVAKRRLDDRSTTVQGALVALTLSPTLKSKTPGEDAGKVSEQMAELKQAVWSAGRALLEPHVGDAKARALVGKLAKVCGVQAAQKMILDASAAADPVAYLMASCDRHEVAKKLEAQGLSVQFLKDGRYRVSNGSNYWHCDKNGKRELAI